MDRQKGFERPQLFQHGGRQRHQRVGSRPHRRHRVRPGRGQPRPRFGAKIVQQRTHQGTDHLADKAGQFQFAIAGGHRARMRAGQRRLGQVGDGKQSCPEPVVQIVIDISDVVGQRRDLGFDAGPLGQVERPARVKSGNRAGHIFSKMRRHYRSIVLDQPFQGFPGEIEAVEIGIAVFEPGHQPERMGVVIEAANIGGGLVQCLLAGMAERGVTQIMGQRDGLGQIFIHLEAARQAARQLRHFQGMSQPGAVIIAFMFHKHLGLVLEAAKGAGMDDAVAVAAVTGAGGAFLFGIKPAAALRHLGGIERKHSGRGNHRTQQTACRSGICRLNALVLGGLFGRHIQDYIR